MLTKETKEKIRNTIVRKGIGFQKGCTPWNKGKSIDNTTKYSREMASLRMKKYWKENRSSLILNIKKSMSNPKIKSLLKEYNKRPRRPMSDEHKSKISNANAGRMPSNMMFNNNYPNIQAGVYGINGKEIYFRSKWEANYALYLDWLVSQNEIVKWEFEPEKFVFEQIKFGTRSYLPDFKIWKKDGSAYFVEVKGYMDSRSKTKLKRMKKYYPKIQIELVDSKSYNDLKRKLGGVLHFY